MTKEEIAKILKQLRIDAGYTQSEAANRIGRKQQTLASWETAQSQPDANTLFVLCSIYNTTVDKAFGFEDKNNVTRYELALIEKYRRLDNHSKELIALVVEKELQRSTAKTPTAETLPGLHDIKDAASQAAEDAMSDFVNNDLPQNKTSKQEV